jgi:hypothetical protein
VKTILPLVVIKSYQVWKISVKTILPLDVIKSYQVWIIGKYHTVPKSYRQIVERG